MGVSCCDNDSEIISVESTPKYQLTRHVAQNKPYLLLVHEVDENVAGMSEQEAGPAAINVLSSGSFVGVGGHAADGVASILSVNGEEYLRFEQFMVTNGPDLHVYLTTGGDVQKGIDLGKLKGSKGDQNYLLNNIDKMNYDTVVIYCQPFHVVFGTAGLT